MQNKKKHDSCIEATLVLFHRLIRHSNVMIPFIHEISPRFPEVSDFFQFPWSLPLVSEAGPRVKRQPVDVKKMCKYFKDSLPSLFAIILSPAYVNAATGIVDISSSIGTNN